ncbi:uncharacterized protein TNCV_839491 [Trichonephila clavipes]|nr:uncharacterized protein TNCV_839491 [Trichonephila clavipes]
MRLLEDADKNGWTVADFSVMMVVVDIGPQQIGRTYLLSDQPAQRLSHHYQPSDVRPTQDMARTHAACVAMSCLAACRTLAWPVRSPDLSSIQTATAGSDVVQSGRPIFDDFFQHLWPYISNNTANVVFQMVKRLWLIHTDQRLYIAPTENSLAVLNHKILEANSQVQKGKLGGHQKCLSINRLWHELCDMLRRLVGTTAPGHHDCSIQE